MGPEEIRPVIQVFDNDPFAMVWQAYRNLYPGRPAPSVEWTHIDENDEETHGAWGYTVFTDDGEVAVFVSCDLKVMDAVEVLAHELAHVAVGAAEDHGEKWEAAFEAIFQEYNRIGAEMTDEEV